MRRTTAERRAAAENIFMHFHVFSCIFNQEHAISEDFKHFHAFWNIFLQYQNGRKVTAPSLQAFSCNFKNDARSHPRVVSIYWITEEQTKQLNGRRMLPDERTPSAHHPRELNKLRWTNETYLNAARRWPVPGVGRRRAHWSKANGERRRRAA